ncbi:bifunctional diaminohydroxyphosphoribosylaminopyrimidine deaminase/5-amino-6-(5-phosphoribosylamino)uracil reductase RibD [uncultured Formosa sp.]|uniref:bifunctional diaminohydroxyphosphoribosylaminopyrimidine deaminase/5-amino-6-(5-phosphoribosylamino)uracil reductase RibD n=1 Tax=uncultured Formosa sp. TaxID=255435 RepID=UPI00261BE52E|nr:bifunctional diaminohydroxyphosphoribosylaminopyrimidine deaminase/5-amino-6-(5-phosphoribosylamino)uracil reductase RibD [uncultured Formosa sp.]
MKIHEKYINRCIEIAKNGLGTTRPNPMVGCVIVVNNAIISEGFTSPYGGPHAEVNAIQSVTDKSVLKNATLYVTLEPCSHFGKTPPCSDLIIRHNIPKVVIGTIDDNSLVAGQGIKKLQNSGCEVIVGVLEAACKDLHKRFFTFHNKKRPYIILKWAQSVDGFIAPKTKKEQKPVWITNIYSRQLVHKWRAEEQAILVGGNTILQDNPSLTVRDWVGLPPTRIVVDTHNNLPEEAAVFNTTAKTIRLTDAELNTSQPLASQICERLHEHNITSVIIEGGSKTLQTFINENLWDEARVFYGTNQFLEGTKAPEIKECLTSETKLLNDTLKYYIND